MTAPLVSLNLQFIGAVLGVGVLAGGAFSYTLFTSKMPQQGSLVTGVSMSRQ